jgi:flagellar L-ring protein precursor FlgH
MKRLTAGLALAACLAACAAQADTLYQEETFRPLTADNKAFRVGDVITVQVFENASATTSADTDTRRKNAVSADLTQNAKARGVALSTNGDFDGGGRTQRSNRVLITLSVSVRGLLPNGDLQVAGEQSLVINGEQQKVTLEGRVRPQDVSDGNVVLSTRLADARISYHGEGALTERQQRPWWRQFLDWAGF